MAIDVRLHPSVPPALRQLRLTPEFEQEVRQRILDDLRDSLQLVGERVEVPVPYTIYPMYVADPDPYSTAIHEFQLYVHQPTTSVRYLLSFSHRIIQTPG